MTGEAGLPPGAIALHIRATPGRFGAATAAMLADRLDGWAPPQAASSEHHELSPAARAVAAAAAANAAALRAGDRELSVTLSPEGVRATDTLALLLDGVASAAGANQAMARLASAWGRAWREAGELTAQQRPTATDSGHAAALFEEAALLALTPAPAPASARSARTLVGAVAEALRTGNSAAMSNHAAAQPDARAALAAAMEFTERTCRRIGDHEGARAAAEWERHLRPDGEQPATPPGPGGGH